MDYKVKVTGKVQNSTALGIMNAYLELNPDSTLADLRRAFPNDIAPDNGVAEIFLPVSEASKFNEKSDSISLYFMKEDRPALTLSDGSQVAVSQIWTSKSLNNLISEAKKYGIQAEVHKGMEKVKYGYAIEHVEQNSSVTPSTPAHEKKKSYLLPLIIMIIVVIGVICLITI